MKKNYEAIVLDILLIEEDAVRCSNSFVFEYGDGVGEDIFGD